MKKILVLMLAMSLGLVACSSSKNTKQDSTVAAKNSKNAKYQIIDQEFDNLLAPEKDYDSLSASELQACGDSYLPDAKLKPLNKANVKAAAKANVNLNEHEKEIVNEHNIYYVEDNGQKTLHSKTVTKKVYKDGEMVSSSTTTGSSTAK